MTTSELIPLVAAALIVLIAAGTDVWKFKVYNVLTFPALLTGLVASTCLGGWDGLRTALLGAALGLGLLIVFFAMGGVGAGDVKLLAALGAWLGPNMIYQVFIASALAAGLYAVVLLVLQGGVLTAFGRVAMIGQKIVMMGPNLRADERVEVEVRRADRRRRLVPFAAMTCAGYFAMLAFWGSHLREIWPPYLNGGIH